MVDLTGQDFGGLRVRHSFPTAAAELPATRLADALGGPTLFDLRKSGRAPLFISVLLHGNETSGWDAVRELHDDLNNASVLLFVGNVAAARDRVRRLPDAADYNRIWNGYDGAEAALANAVTKYAREANPYLAVDIHNNTGDNPPYAVITDTRAATLAVARAFARQALIGTQPDGILSRRLSDFCTALTVEVGTPSDPHSTPRARCFLKRLLREAKLPPHPPADLALFKTTARLHLTDAAELDPAMQRFNFRPVPPGTALTRRGTLRALDESGRDVTDVYLADRHGATVMRQRRHVAMYTGSAQSARQDCLCYVLQAEPESFQARDSDG